MHGHRLLAAPGIVGTLGPDYPQPGVSAGVNAANVLPGAEVAQAPFTTPGKVTIVLNQAAAQEFSMNVSGAAGRPLPRRA